MRLKNKMVGNLKKVGVILFRVSKKRTIKMPTLEEKKDYLSAIQYKALIGYRNELIYDLYTEAKEPLKPIELAYIFNKSKQSINEILKKYKKHDNKK